MSDNEQLMAKASAVQAEHADKLLEMANVVGVGIGLRQRGGEYTDEVCLVVMVDQKLPVAQLASEDVIPDTLDGVPVDVQETGTFTAG